MDTIQMILLGMILLGMIVAALVVYTVLAAVRKPSKASDDRRFFQLEQSMEKILRDEFERGHEASDRAAKDSREENSRASRESREELMNSFGVLNRSLAANMASLSDTQKKQFEAFSVQLKDLTETFAGHSEQLRKTLSQTAKEGREEQSRSLKSFEESVNLRFQEIRVENAKKLDEMKRTVDENLKEAVEKRFNDSFRLISDRLEQVHKGLGEMQQLANGVGDLKKIMSNVKTRGSLGEIQLGSILEQILAPEQYEAQVSVGKNGAERVDYVIKLPDKNTDSRELLLPIDSKFPLEDYRRLTDAYERNENADAAARLFENAVRLNAKSISAKYINPPVTTDFAILFVPTEGLYAEIVRRTALFEQLQREFKVTVVGPTNLAAFLNSLQMGFRTLAIERRSSEVWGLLGAVKTEFGKFGDVIDKIKNRLNTAVNEIDQVGVRTRAIERKLKGVEELPAEKSAQLLE
ncbi:MAG: DNA recombination protein RmuC [Clostridium sp.]|jgi:DNA recombination protein RmuC|nr:DNA recombination protein RmuC [Clostridium sp.]